ncbi:MAG TPA: mucoidy inhibitor MuiA family protein [Xanthobacteraceae bacterium]|nr:mucoidy inhibitor MuiA family protein [Xanthobacteraceae bacterium]
MRHFPLVLTLSCAVALARAASAAELDVGSAIDAVTVYPDGAAVTRIIHVDVPAGDSVLFARDFPPSLDPATLRVEGEGGAHLTMGAIDARPPRSEPPRVIPELDAKLEALQDERTALDDKIAAATARKRFALRFAEKSPAGLGEKGEARPLADWRAAFAAVADEVATADEAIRAARIRQREIDRERQRLQAQRTANPPRKMEVRIDLAADAPTAATFRVTYMVPGARWRPLYDARLDSGARDRKPSLELVRRAEILQQSGEDWSGVALSVSTVRTARGGNAPELPPLLVGYLLPPPPPASAPMAKREDRDAASEADQNARARGHLSYVPSSPLSDDEVPLSGGLLAQEQNATFATGGFQAVFRIPGRVSVATNEGAKSFRIGGTTITPDLLVRATPVVDATAYLEADFKQGEEAPLLPGVISLYRDGVFVGRSRMALTPKDETVRLGFGVDDQVKVARVTIRKQEGSTGLISTAKTDEREFRITVRNGHVIPIRVSIEDQIPVSEIDDVKVEMLASTTQPTERDVRNRRGVLGWTFTAAPGEAHEINLGWSVRWPSGRTVVYGPGQS